MLFCFPSCGPCPGKHDRFILDLGHKQLGVCLSRQRGCAEDEKPLLCLIGIRLKQGDKCVGSSRGRAERAEDTTETGERSALEYIHTAAAGAAAGRGGRRGGRRRAPQSCPTHPSIDADSKSPTITSSTISQITIHSSLRQFVLAGERGNS